MSPRRPAFAWSAALLALGCGASTTDPALDAGAPTARSLAPRAAIGRSPRTGGGFSRKTGAGPGKPPVPGRYLHGVAHSSFTSSGR